MKPVVHIAVLASGAGSNAASIMAYFRHHPRIRVALVLSDNPAAAVLQEAAAADVPTRVFSREAFRRGAEVMDCLAALAVDWIVLAGFLTLVPENILAAWPGRVVNIHPALLPEFGGKGMYGIRVHEAVVRAGKKESGITVHRVNGRYDEGDILFQEKIPLAENETATSLQEKIKALEHDRYPRIIETLIG